MTEQSRTPEEGQRGTGEKGRSWLYSKNAEQMTQEKKTNKTQILSAFGVVVAESQSKHILC